MPHILNTNLRVAYSKNHWERSAIGSYQLKVKNLFSLNNLSNSPASKTSHSATRTLHSYCGSLMFDTNEEKALFSIYLPLQSQSPPWWSWPFVLPGNILCKWNLIQIMTHLLRTLVYVLFSPKHGQLKASDWTFYNSILTTWPPNVWIMLKMNGCPE